MSQKDAQKKAFWEKLPQAERRRLVWITAGILTLAIFVLWVALFQIIVAPTDRDIDRSKKFESLQADISTFLDKTKAGLDQTRKQLERLNEKATNSDATNPEIIAALKERLLNTTSENWKNYTSKRYGFSISYPNDWIVNTTTATTTEADFLLSIHPAEENLTNTGLWVYGSNNADLTEGCTGTFQALAACTSTSTDQQIATTITEVINPPKKIILVMRAPLDHQNSFEEIFKTLRATISFTKPDTRL